METRSYFQLRVAVFTSRTIFFAVMNGPEGILTGCFCPVACILIFVPPTSSTSIVREDFAMICPNSRELFLLRVKAFKLRSFSNPPENLRQYFPLVLAIERDRFVVSIFRL